MNRPEVNYEMLEWAKIKIGETQELAIAKHSRGAFRSVFEINQQLRKQFQQLRQAQDEFDPTYDLDEYAKQLAQIGQLAVFGLASLETWEGKK